MRNSFSYSLSAKTEKEICLVTLYAWTIFLQRSDLLMQTLKMNRKKTFRKYQSCF